MKEFTKSNFKVDCNCYSYVKKYCSMRDVAMCQHKTCPSQSTCWRHPASGVVTQPFQTYALFELENGEDKCEFYIEKFDEPSVSVRKTELY